MGAKTQIVQTCRDSCSLSSVPLTCQWAWKIEFPRFFCALLQLLAGPLSSSQGFSALPVFTTPVLEFVSWVCCDLTHSPFKPKTCVIPNWAAPRFKTKNHFKTLKLSMQHLRQPQHYNFICRSSIMKTNYPENSAGYLFSLFIYLFIYAGYLFREFSSRPANHPAAPPDPACSFSLLLFSAPACSRCLLCREELGTGCVSSCREPFH